MASKAGTLKLFRCAQNCQQGDGQRSTQDGENWESKLEQLTRKHQVFSLLET
jgi:hypothetical protein